MAIRKPIKTFADEIEDGIDVAFTDSIYFRGELDRKLAAVMNRLYKSGDKDLARSVNKLLLEAWDVVDKMEAEFVKIDTLASRLVSRCRESFKDSDSLN